MPNFWRDKLSLMGVGVDYGLPQTDSQVSTTCFDVNLKGNYAARTAHSVLPWMSGQIHAPSQHCSIPVTHRPGKPSQSRIGVGLTVAGATFALMPCTIFQSDVKSVFGVDPAGNVKIEAMARSVGEDAMPVPPPRISMIEGIDGSVKAGSDTSAGGATANPAGTGGNNAPTQGTRPLLQIHGNGTGG